MKTMLIIAMLLVSGCTSMGTILSGMGKGVQNQQQQKKYDCNRVGFNGDMECVER